MRNDIISVYDVLKMNGDNKNIDLYIVFEDALKEISRIVQDGPWKEFVLSREDKLKKRLMVVSNKVHNDPE